MRLTSSARSSASLIAAVDSRMYPSSRPSSRSPVPTVATSGAIVGSKGFCVDLMHGRTNSCGVDRRRRGTGAEYTYLQLMISIPRRDASHSDLKRVSPGLETIQPCTG